MRAWTRWRMRRWWRTRHTAARQERLRREMIGQGKRVMTLDGGERAALMALGAAAIDIEALIARMRAERCRAC
jgi:hypothetical protein